MERTIVYVPIFRPTRTMSTKRVRSESHSTFIIRENEPVSHAIARAVCTIEDAPINELSPLYHTVKTKALDDLPEDLHPRKIIQFKYWNYRMNIIGQNLIEVWSTKSKRFN